MTPELFTHLPDLPAAGGLLLDLGCGEGAYSKLLRSTGFEYVGLDATGSTADILADAHHLPFRDGSIDAIAAISILEHLRAPAVALREVARVLRPGGVIIGSVAFLEAFHLNSYFHHTHLGTIQALTDGGLEPDVVAPAADWPGIRAITEMGLLPGFPRIVARAVSWPLEVASRLGWRIGRAAGRGRSDLDRALLAPAGFRFVAHRPLDTSLKGLALFLVCKLADMGDVISLFPNA
ncbi:MAG: class I SAM-dependent methyltransferase [Chloroflexota bacterium]|nr:class I SAM-dependent methyltransferase [Chloroflexota bacterium]